MSNTNSTATSAAANFDGGKASPGTITLPASQVAPESTGNQRKGGMQPRGVSAGEKKSRKRRKHRGHRAASGRNFAPAGKIAGNGPQIVEAVSASNDQPNTESRARSGNAAIFDGIAPRLVASGRQEAARRGISFPELISGYLRTFRPDHLLYREVLRKLVARNNEDLQEEKELHRDYARDQKPVPEYHKREEEKLFRRMWLLEALEECQPDRLRYLLIATHAPITEGDKELLDFLSALWPWQEE